MFFKKPEEEQNQRTLIAEYRQLITSATMPEGVEKIALQELDTLSRISPSTAEYTIGLNYIDYLVRMPWNRKTEDTLDLGLAARILNEAHYGLDKIKERVLEHIAVKVLRSSNRPRVLIVDDEEIARKNLVHVLRGEHYDVQAAADGLDALQEMTASEFDVVVTDLKMARMDGMELLDKIHVKFPETVVVVITGYATVPSAVEAMKKGAFSYIAKPFKLEDVRTTVRDAVQKKSLMQSTKGSVLCFAGPPGTGKTSLGRAIARALGRKFSRISLGGMKDVSEIHGHRRTYAGAMPGRIIEEIRRAESSNPVMMLDEIDKIGRDVKGDPSSALLEILDPEQNQGFVDHYLDVAFDLSSILFIITANVVENIPSPLRDRMEVISFSGYAHEEKAYIAEKFLIPKQIQEKGLYENPPLFAREAIDKIIQEYTHEAGIRSLERRIASICRKMAKEVVESSAAPGGVRERIEITPQLVEEYLGRRKYHREVIEGKDRIGVATALVLTEAGGEIVFIEAALMKGKQEVILTGSLGNVMKESAQAALSYVRSNATAFGISEDFFEGQDVHIHVPSGAIQKDGPSAGITIAMALISLLTKRPVRRDVAMTGEITLTGRLLPVGGIKEKILAARRVMAKRVVMPAENRVDIEELTDEMKKGIDISLVDTADEVVELVLAD